MLDTYMRFYFIFLLLFSSFEILGYWMLCLFVSLQFLDYFNFIGLHSFWGHSVVSELWSWMHSRYIFWSITFFLLGIFRRLLFIRLLVLSALMYFAIIVTCLCYLNFYMNKKHLLLDAIELVELGNVSLTRKGELDFRVVLWT